MKRVLVLSALMTLSLSAVAQTAETEGAAINGIVPAGAGWADSYSADGKCYIASTFDHDIGSVVVATPIGGQTVRQVADRIGPGPGISGNPLYNDVQCGNGPPNSAPAGDEDFGNCPGRVDMGAAGCGIIGPLWDLQSAYASTSTPTAPIVQGQCEVTAQTLSGAKAAFSTSCPGIPDRSRDCDPIVLDGRSSWMCANYRIGTASPGNLPPPSAPVTPPVVVTPPQTPSTPTNLSACAVVGASLSDAKTRYQTSCQVPLNLPRRDCDPISGSKQYICASYVNPVHSDDSVLSQAQGSAPLPDFISGTDEPVNPDPTPEPPVTPPTTPTTPTNPDPAPTGPRSVTAATAAAGYSLFRDTYGVPAVDCDPISGGRYRCSDNQIGSGSPGTSGGSSGGGSAPTGGSGANPDAPTVPPVSSSGTGSSTAFRLQSESASIGGGSEWIRTADGIEYRGPNRYTTPGNEVLSFNFTVPDSGVWEVLVRARATKETFENGKKRSDLHNDAWIKVNGQVVTGYTDIRVFRKVFLSGSGSWSTAGTIDVHNQRTRIGQLFTEGTTYTIELSGRSDFFEIDYFELRPIAIDGETTTRPIPELPPLLDAAAYRDTFNQPYVDGDLLSIHWDSSMDPDDEQAMIASREILNSRPDVDFIVINGTKKVSNDRILGNSTSIMNSLFEGGYDAFADNTGTVRQAATLWQLTLASGGRVHVAEGGPADFTAQVLTELVVRGVPIDSLKRVRVVQHSWGWNERMTTPEGLDTVRRYASYIRINNGNTVNDTPDFNAEITGPGAEEFRARALSSQYASVWARAFRDIRNKVDFSDSVEVMWILGIPKSFAPDAVGFADRYFFD